MKREQVVIHTPFIKLDAALKYCGAISTGGTARALLEMELVRVEGELCTQRGRKLYPGMVFSLEGQEYEVVAGED